MKSRILLFVALLAVVGMVAVGCNKKSTETPGPSSAQDAGTTAVKTQTEYKAAAEKEITKENAEAELDKLTKDIEADK
jgi:hypothetical protein